MKKYDKRKSLILQQIRTNNTKKKRRKKNKKKFKKQNKGPVLSPRISRSIRRRMLVVGSNGKITASSTITNFKKEEYISKYLPENLNYLVHNQDSPFNIKEIKKEKFNSNGVVDIPEIFSIIEKPNESYLTLKKLISALLLENNTRVILNYKYCKKVGLGTQVLLDIILMDFLRFSNKCQRIDRNRIQHFPIVIGGEEINEESVQKIIFSIGSPVTLKVREYNFPDIVKYKLCIHNNSLDGDPINRMMQKLLDTTELADYVNTSLARMNKKLTSEKLDDLCTVIGEILINAEEHSTTKHRFSIGYFIENKQNGNHSGIFRLVILNFGRTIYEKFSSEDCPNQEIVTKMKDLSRSYTKRNIFRQREFEEETLWTLYALQEGVSSIASKERKRGNGSIRFIDSFFNLKGSMDTDKISKMTIISGRTQITFDGKYMISHKTNEQNESFKVMTFNDSGNIEEKPDNNYVFYNDVYFPGTIISARILLNEDDFQQSNN